MKRSLRAKKLMSVLLLVVMLMSMLPAAYADGGKDPIVEDKVINELTLNVPPNPVEGEKAKRESGSVPEMYSYTMKWYEGETLLEDEAVFEKDKIYCVRFELNAMDGCVFADSIEVHGIGTSPIMSRPLTAKVFAFTNQFKAGAATPSTPTVKIIDELYAPRPANPVVGQPAKQVSGETEQYSYTMEWCEGFTMMNDGDSFKAGVDYSAEYSFTPKEGFKFKDTVLVRGIREKAFFITMPGANVITYSLMLGQAGAAEPTPSAPVLTPVTSIALTGPKAPVTGEAISSYSASDTGYTAEGKWFVGENEFTGDKFAPETEYTLAVTVTAAEGFSFADLETVTMDGETMTFTRGLADAEVLHFSKTYPKTEAETVAVARIVRDGKNVDFETFDAAFKDAKDREEILLLTSCDTDAGINLNKNIIVSALEGLEEKPVLNFTTYGMALWGKSITFNNIDIVMNGIGSTPYTAEWGWMAICGNANSEIVLNNVNMSMDGQNVKKNAIYAGSGMHLVLNSSVLSIKDYKDDALEWNGGSFDYNVEMTNSHYVSDHNRSGFTGTFNVKTLNSTVDVINSRGNGSNGSHFYFTDSTVNFNNNGGHGLSAGNLVVVNTKINGNNNKYYGVTCSGKFSVDGKSSIQATVNGAGYIGGGIRLTSGTPDGIVKSGAVLKINNNLRNGIENYRNTVIEEGVTLEVMNNSEPNFGGGIYNAAAISLPSDAKIYNNHAGKGGDDIASKGEEVSVTIGPVGSDWALDGTEGTNDCLKAIDGWYRDEEEAERPAPMAAAAGINSGRWNAHSLEKLFVENVEPGTLTGPVFLKAAHGIGEKKTETPSELKFVKTDSMTGKPIKGAEFTLYSDEALKTVKASYVSDEKGEFVISELPGAYYLKETKPAAGYRDNNTVYHVYIRPEIIEDELLVDTSVTPNEVYSSVKSVSYGYVENMEPDSTGRYGITNDIINEKTIEIKKIWRDKEGMRARTSSVEIALYADKAEYEIFTLCNDNNWSMKLTVPKYDEMGKEIKYSVKELTKVKDYNVSYDGLNVINTHRLYNPKTGDESNIWLWVGILAAAAAAAGVVAYVLIKKRKTDN